MNAYQSTLFEATEDVASRPELPSGRLTPLPQAVIPEPPPMPPTPPLEKGQKVAVIDPAGDWVGIVHSDDGGPVLFVSQPGKTVAIGYQRNQVKLLPEPGTLTTDPELLEQERDRRERQRREHPWVDCFQCSFHSPIDSATYSCQNLPFPIFRKAPYGTHIGCRLFEEKES